MTIYAIPMTLREANDFIEAYHRHNGRTTRNGGKFAIGASDGEQLIGVAITGRPLARVYQDGFTAEVLRVCVLENSPKGANSFLYGACWRAWKAMGGKRLITYTLTTESGASLRGAGWKVLHEVAPSPNGWDRDGRKRRWQPIYGQKKLCWEVKQ